MSTTSLDRSILALLRPLVILFTAVLLSGCPHLQLIAEYDAKNFEETIRIGKGVDVFYGRMIEKPVTERAYSGFADQYVEIEADIRSLVRRNEARQLNEESTRITKIILEFWIQYRKKHKSANRYDDARLDRLRFNRLFTAAAAAETVKKLKTGDQTPEKSEED